MNNKEFNINSILEVNRTIHEPARLLILCYLHVVEYCDFIFLLKNTGLTKGNLSCHLKKLEEVEYIEINKKFIDKKSNTIVKITKLGLLEFQKYKINIEMFWEHLS